MKGYAMLGIGKTGWIEKERPLCGPLDAIVRPIAVSPCTSDVHTVWEGAIGDRHNMILGHECCAEVVEVGSMVKDFKPGDRVLVPAITPDWNSLEAQAGFSMHSGGMLAGWKFSNFKDGVFSEYFHVNDADGKIIARGYNRRNTDKNTLSHAELNAIRKASKKLGDWRLEGCTMYVTLEPCQMCAGALVQSRIDRVVIGSMNPKAGCAGSVLNLLQIAGFNHQVEIVQGVCQEECSSMLSSFFKELRKKKKQKKNTPETM